MRVSVIAVRHPEHPDLFLHGLRRDGKWSLPAGHVKDGENMHEAARRELREETGLEVSKLEHARNGEYPHPDGEPLQVSLFLSDPTMFKPSPDNDPDDEFMAFKYLKPHDIVNCHVPHERNILIHHLDSMSKSEALIKANLFENEDAAPLMNRKEDKYLVKREYVDKITDVLRDKLKEGDSDTSVRYNVNRTFYLDNKDMDAYRDSINGVRPRFKVRIRQYAPNGKDWENVAYVELKIKVRDGETKKVRIRVPEEMIDHIAAGNKIDSSNKLEELNRDISKELFWKRVAAMNSVITKYGFKKQLVVTYQRRAYSNKKVRITLDDALRYYDASSIHPDAEQSIIQADGWKSSKKMYDKVKDSDLLILEVKHEENQPEWVSELLKEVKAKPVKFSKYCAAVTTFIENHGKKEAFLMRVARVDTNHILSMVKSEDLEKMGVMRRKFPFQPTKDLASNAFDALHHWQQYQGGDPDTSDPVVHRETMAYMHGHAKARAMNRLMSETRWKANPTTREREFLLHRGMSDEEHMDNINHEAGIVHHNKMRSSWTSDPQKAKQFTDKRYMMNNGITPKEGPYHVVSAWVPESKIIHVPYMYGNVNPYSRAGENEYKNEHEVVVEARHNSRIEPAVRPSPSIHETISHRRPGDILSEIEARRTFRQAQERAMKGMSPEQQAKIKSKLAASENGLDFEDLEKAEPPPSFQYQQHPENPDYHADFHPTNKSLVYTLKPAAAQKMDKAVKANFPKFLQQFPPEHHAIIREFANHIMSNPARHARSGFDNLATREVVPRSRHLLALTRGENNAKISVSGNHVGFVIARHRDRPNELSSWLYSRGGKLKEFGKNENNDLQRSTELFIYDGADIGNYEELGRTRSLDDAEGDVSVVYSDVRSGIHDGEQRGSESTSDASWDNSLGKGVVQRKFPFNPSNVPGYEREAAEEWTGGYSEGRRELREGIPKMSQEALVRGTNKLLKLTQHRRNPQTGEVEILLHRGMGSQEHGDTVRNKFYHGVGKSSWTPREDLAHNFARDYSETGLLAGGVKQPETPGHLVSAWVPISNIHHIPFQLGSTARDYDQPADPEVIPAKHLRRNEHEVIVSQKPMEIHTYKPVNYMDEYQKPGQKPNPFKLEYPKKLAASEQEYGELLEKMPKVFEPTKKKPYTTVVRVQDIGEQGPYGGEVHELRSHGGPETPTAQTDPGFTQEDLKDLRSDIGINPKYPGIHRFGFESEQQMHQWFKPHELEAMANEGFEPTKVKASHVWSSGKQVFFQRYVAPKRAKKQEMSKAEPAGPPTSLEAEKKRRETIRMWKLIGKYHPDKKSVQKPKEPVKKSEDLTKIDPTYVQHAKSRLTLLWPVRIRGQQNISGTNLPMHITLKQFPQELATDPEKLKGLVNSMDWTKPEPSKMEFEPSQFTGQDKITQYHVLKLKGGMPESAHKLYDQTRGAGITYPEYQPHVTVPKDLWKEIKEKGLQPHHVQLEIGNLQLRDGNTILHEWEHPKRPNN